MQLELMKSIPKWSAGIQQSDLADGCMLLDQEKAIAFALNVTASLMWSHCDGQHTIEEITEIIAETSSLPADRITEDVTRTIKDFHEHGLLSFVESRQGYFYEKIL
jgi:Coenzyme PQQ synthesis protein D (PqqD)